jgi:IS1 family transposase
MKSERIMKSKEEIWAVPLKGGHYKFVVQNRSKTPIQALILLTDKLESKAIVDDEWGIIAHMGDKKRSKYHTKIRITGDVGTLVAITLYSATKSYLLDYKKEGESIETCKSLDLMQ